MGGTLQFLSRAGSASASTAWPSRAMSPNRTASISGPGQEPGKVLLCKLPRCTSSFAVATLSLATAMSKAVIARLLCTSRRLLRSPRSSAARQRAAAAARASCSAAMCRGVAPKASTASTDPCAPTNIVTMPLAYGPPILATSCRGVEPIAPSTEQAPLLRGADKAAAAAAGDSAAASRNMITSEPHGVVCRDEAGARRQRKARTSTFSSTEQLPIGRCYTAPRPRAFQNP
mmetsp:Transcript_105114/g.307180  ORF Transcript_105114/g.307180 Transcript_105114/m.307180 type:complete len:231 (+) Transcript_105114:1237-1929(+)